MHADAAMDMKQLFGVYGGVILLNIISVCFPFWFLCQMALVRPHCLNIAQLSLMNHHKPWFQEEDPTGELSSTTGSLGITIPAKKLHHTSSYSITSTVLQWLRDRRVFNGLKARWHREAYICVMMLNNSKIFARKHDQHVQI